MELKAFKLLLYLIDILAKEVLFSRQKVQHNINKHKKSSPGLPKWKTHAQTHRVVI